MTEAPFAYSVTKDRRVMITWQGKTVTIIKGSRAERFLAAVGKADTASAQLLMAKATGNFKRGNERL